jgi:hypothetical protein
MRGAGVPFNDWIEDFVLLEAFAQLQVSDLIVCDRVAVSGLVWEKMAGAGLNISDHPLQPYFWERIAQEIDRRLMSFKCVCIFLWGNPKVLAQRCRQSEEMIAAEQRFYIDLIEHSEVEWKVINTAECTKEETWKDIWDEVYPFTCPL